MPLYEYACQDCGHRFEHLVFGKAAPACPACGNRRVSKQLSVFAVASSSGRARPQSEGPAAGCGSCGDPRGPGSCAND